MPQFAKTTTVAAGPTALVGKCTNYRTLKLIACKTLAGPTASPNTGVVKVGASPNANEQPLEMNPGDERSFDAAAGKQEDMTKWYFTVANDGDGVVAVYS